ncbi:unnamed protein product [Paramecium primaurelia]|uniref:Uncharacterized protein n=1 Tax=Paramecium primaurelia TaxID=5886 RepID=A0A8S1NJU1_PARPR|nr:unnamed protein product [Paramecium primaurelia]
MNSGEYKKFEELELDYWLLKLFWKIDYKEPRPIQVLSIPPLLQGKNVLSILNRYWKNSCILISNSLKIKSRSILDFCNYIDCKQRTGNWLYQQEVFPLQNKQSNQDKSHIKQLEHLEDVQNYQALMLISRNIFKMLNISYWMKQIDYQNLDDIKKVYEQCQSPQMALVSTTLNNVTYQLKNEFNDVNFVDCINNPEQKVSETIQ